MREKTFDKVKDFVKENEMLARNCAVIAGVSGGNDSMTMLHLLMFWIRIMNTIRVLLM